MSDKANQWHPIDDAPKDGTHVLGFVESRFYETSWQVVMFWNDITDDESGMFTWVSPLGDGKGPIDSCTSEPTHYMHLPKPPKKGE